MKKIMSMAIAGLLVGTLLIDGSAVAQTATDTRSGPAPRVSETRLERTLPPARLFGSGAIASDFGALAAFCGRRVGGPMPTVSAGARIAHFPAVTIVQVEEHRSVRDAKRRVRSLGSKYVRYCNRTQTPTGAVRRVRKSAPLDPRLGSPRAGATAELRDGREVIARGRFSIHRIGRFVVSYEVLTVGVGDPPVVDARQARHALGHTARRVGRL